MSVEGHHGTDKEDPWGPQEESVMLTRLEKIMEPSLMGLDSTDPPPDRQRKSMMMFTFFKNQECNTLWGLEGTRGNF